MIDMKKHLKLTVSLCLLTCLFACSNKSKDLIKIDEVVPWCIIGFDALDRTPKQRIAMLKQMGFTTYGFNKGKGDLSTMKLEFQLAKDNDIEITSIFLWLNAQRDSIDKLSTMNQELLDNLSKIDSKPTIWLSFSNNYFEDLNQQESIALSVEMIDYVKTLADTLGCKLALYNHHGWFGNPHNQVEILKQLNDDSISMVYNFHHAQDYVDEFPLIVKKMKPYLSFVNLNGLKKDGPQILTIGQGDHEYEMINELVNSRYNGPWGILGHIKTEDVQYVLKRNIEGLRSLNSQYQTESNK